jgi:hypothetical protein
VAGPSLRELAEDAGVHMPLRAGVERVADERFVLVASAWPHVSVWRLRLGDDVGGAVESVRAEMRGRGKERALWLVGESATPAGVAARLAEHGLVPDPDEPLLTAMALTAAPRLAAGRLRVEAVRSYDELLLAQEIDWEAMRVAEEDRSEMRAALPERWELLRGDGVARYYLAYDGDEAIASAHALFGDDAVFLLGGATLPHARGRGAYAALVAARWRDAVDAGTPALVVQATSMSAPILERHGFERLGAIELYADRLS